MSCLTFEALSVGTPHCFYEHINEKKNFPQEHETCHLSTLPLHVQIVSPD